MARYPTRNVTADDGGSATVQTQIDEKGNPLSFLLLYIEQGAGPDAAPYYIPLTAPQSRRLASFLIAAAGHLDAANAAEE